MKLEIKATEIKKSSNGETAAPKAYFTDGKDCVAASFITITTESVYMIPAACVDNILSSDDAAAAIENVTGLIADTTTTAKVTRTTLNNKGEMATGKGKIATESAYRLYGMLTAKGKDSKQKRESAQTILNKWRDCSEAARNRAAAEAVDSAMDSVDTSALAAAVLNNPELMAAIRAAL